MKSILFIGAGSIGRRHIGNFLDAGVPRVSCVDAREDRLAEAREKLPKIHATYSDYKEALATGKYEAVGITVPPHLHLPMATEAARAGCHLFIEKPLGMSIQGWDEVASLCREKKLAVLVAFCHRFVSYSKTLKDLIDSGRIGRPVHANMVWGSYLPDWHPWEDYRTFYMAKKEQGGGALMDESHGLDLLRYLLGEVTLVGAIVDTISDLEITSDDAAFMTLRFQSGLVANACFDLQSRVARCRLEIVGTKGNLIWDRCEPSIQIYDAETKQWEKHDFTVENTLSMYPNETQHFIDCVDGKASSLIDLDDGLKTQKVIDAAFVSSEQKKFVEV